MKPRRMSHCALTSSRIMKRRKRNKYEEQMKYM